MEWKIEIRNKKGIFDPLGKGIEKDVKDLGIVGVKKISTAQVFVICGDISETDADRIAGELLVDPVTQRYILEERRQHKAQYASGLFKMRVAEIAYNPGVMDPVEDSAKKAISDMGVHGLKSVKTERKYSIQGRISKSQFKTICEKLLYNRVIQHVVRDVRAEGPRSTLERDFKVVTVGLLKAGDRKLMKISKDGQLFLNLKEMREIKRYFTKIRRNPTDCELETIAQTWSEHCAHKTFKGVVEYREKGGASTARGRGLGSRNIDNLLKNTIIKATEELNKSWCISVFKDNAGIIKFDKRDNICFKVETHNHPSALEPYGGAGTGIGGVIRDILGAGLGAKPIMNTDVFCFGLPDARRKDVPKGMLHPKRIMKGVVSGVRDYGNRMGIPTANGAVIFDERYIGNPLVYCGTVGIMPKDKSFKHAETGDYIVVVGGKTGRDGIHGATFSSGELTHESEDISGGAVQIGNPITEKKLTDTLLEARDRNLYNSITDCGAGGFSSAVGEMGQHLGAEIDLEKVPLKYHGLSYTEIWISEAQERMVLSVPNETIDELLDVFKKEDVEAVIIGRFTDDKRLRLRYKGIMVCDLDMGFLHDGIPRFKRKAVWSLPRYKRSNKTAPKDLTQSLLKILSSWSVSSKEWVIRQYDHEVQGQSVLKPLVGVKDDGPGDATVIRPKFDSKKGIIVSNGINPRYGFIDPYWMAASCIDEALRQIVATGGSLKNTALLDNFCWGNTDKPDRLGGLVRASFGCYDIARAYGTPFISGKDSLNNEYSVHGRSISIPPTLLISAMCVMEDVTKVISMDFKKAGDLIYVVGITRDELGGSHYNMINGAIGNDVPVVNAKYGAGVFAALNRAINRGLVEACHDCSEGGVGVSVAEMCFAGGFGAEVFLKEVPYRNRSEIRISSAKGGSSAGRKSESFKRDHILLFSESNTRFIVEVNRRNKKDFESIMSRVPMGLIGCVSEEKGLKVYGLGDTRVIDVSVQRLKEAWQSPLRW